MVKYKINSDLKIREEFFGGLIFNKYSGKIIEINKTAFDYIKAIISKDELDNIYKKYATFPNDKIESDMKNFLNKLIEKR